jgi:hypothetical protein
MSAPKRVRTSQDCAQVLGMHEPPQSILPYLTAACSFFESESRRLGKMMPDGRVGAAPMVLLQNAALSLVYSRLAVSEDRPDAGVRFSRDARENLKEAHALARLEYESRKESGMLDSPDALPELSDAEMAKLLEAAGDK